ncbi:MAG: PIG-L family deacetylase [Lapillicoccus sp.]
MTTPVPATANTSNIDTPDVDTLPTWTSVLAVVAHPDDESFGLGAVLDTFARRGAKVSVLCLTHGEASTLHGVDGVASDLSAVRETELVAAADVLGLSQTWMLDHPDGALAGVGHGVLTEAVLAAAKEASPDGLLAFDTTGVTGHPDHIAATTAALQAADRLGIPVLGWTLPDTVADHLNAELGASFVGRPAAQVDLQVRVDRSRQRAASRAHTSQALPESVLWRRLDLLGDGESLRWLQPTPPAARVTHRGGDAFEVVMRGHRIRVDQPVADGGDDTAPTPTELFIASLASCVAFYVRRYLDRHDLPTAGLEVDADFTMGSRPARVVALDVQVILPGGIPDARRDAALAVARHCTVHNTLNAPPDVTISLAD